MDEIEGIVVRLTGDGSQYKQMLKEAAATTKETEEAIISVKNHLDGFGKQLSRFAELAVAAIALKGLRDFFSESIAAWKETEDNAIKLNAILVANGRDVDAVTERYNDFAGGMQRLTTTSDDATIALLSQAESFDLTGAAAEKAVKDALGFAAMNDGNAASYLRLTAALAKGDVEMVKRFARMVPQLRGITDETLLMQKANLLASTGFATAERQAGTLTGQLTQLSNAWGDIMETIGETLSEVAKPFVQIVRSIVDFLGEFSTESKQAATSVLLVAAGMSAIGPIASAYKATLSPLFTMMDDGFRLAYRGIVQLLNPLKLVKLALYGIQIAAGKVKIALAFLASGPGLALLAIGAAIGIVIDQLGGFAEAWNYLKAVVFAVWDTIKENVLAFWEWFVPIGRAALGVLSAYWDVWSGVILGVWDVIKAVASAVWNFIKGIWTSLVGDSQLDWTKIRDFIVDALIFVEFYIRNFGKVWNLIWLGVKGGAVRFVNDFIFFFSDTIPTVLSWFGRNWRNIFTDIFNFTTTVFTNLSNNIVNVLKNLPDLIRGNVKFGDLWKPLLDGFRATTERLVLPQRLETELEASIRREFDAANNALRESWEAFRARRREQIFAINSEDPKDKPIPKAIQEDVKAAKKEIDNLQHVLRYSAEALSRIMKQQEMIRGGPRVNPTTSRAVPAQSNAVAANTTEAVRRGNSFLERIESHLADMRRNQRNNDTNIAPANLNP